MRRFWRRFTDISLDLSIVDVQLSNCVVSVETVIWKTTPEKSVMKAANVTTEQIVQEIQVFALSMDGVNADLVRVPYVHPPVLHHTVVMES